MLSLGILDKGESVETDREEEEAWSSYAMFFFSFFSHMLRRLSVHLAVGIKIASTTGL